MVGGHSLGNAMAAMGQTFGDSPVKLTEICLDMSRRGIPWISRTNDLQMVVFSMAYLSLQSRSHKID